MRSSQPIGLFDAEHAQRLEGLIPSLASLFSVRFVRSDRGIAVATGRIVSALPPDTRRFAPPDTPTLELPPVRSGGETIAIEEVRFASGSQAPWPFRGRSLRLRATLDAATHASMCSDEGAEVLATDRDGRPLWSVDRRGPSPIHRTSLQIPDAQAGSDSGIEVGGERFIQALPLFHFLREATRGQAFANPRLRAGYIIDDPNLHWPSYGYVDYRELAMSAQRDRFHVAFATIPLDAWWVHPSAVDIFRSNSACLSLLIHGNNHARQELAQDYSREQCAALLRQAVARIQRLEAKSGLRVCRTMVPPHGACSAQMLAQLPRQGFEAACISAGSLRAHNAGQAWTKSLGLAPSEMVSGCPVLPRWPFAGSTEATLLTAAYLGQPLILRGHHGDLKDGPTVLRDFAKTINSLGDVAWGSLSQLARANYRHRLNGATIHVEPLGTHVRVTVPSDADRLEIEAGGFDWDVLGPHGRLEKHPEEATWAVRPGETYSLMRRVSHDAEDATDRAPAIDVALILRRFLTETRDRLRIA